jgi:hypothetical protein
MIGKGSELADLRLDLGWAAAPSATTQERAAAILQRLERILPFDAGWLAVRDPEQHRHVPLATTGAAAPLRDYFGRPEADEEVDQLGLNRHRPPMLATEIPRPLTEVRAWADHLLPAGSRQGLAAPSSRRTGSTSASSACPPPIRRDRARQTGGSSRPSPR